jgi:hypothetical protein
LKFAAVLEEFPARSHKMDKTKKEKDQVRQEHQKETNRSIDPYKKINDSSFSESLINLNNNFKIKKK